MRTRRMVCPCSFWTFVVLLISSPLLIASPLHPGESPIPPEATPAEGSVKTPDTPAGRCAFAYIEAFNSGDEDKMRAFWRKYTGASKSTLATRINEYRKYHGMAGAMIPLRILHSSKCLISIQTRSEKEDAYWFLDFHLMSAPPYALASNSLTGPIDHEVREGELMYFVAADSLLRRKIVDKVSELLKAEYVFIDQAEAMATLIGKNLDNGKYDQLSSLGRFTAQLTKDLRSVYDDHHLIVEAGVNKEWECAEDLPEMEQKRQLAARRYENFGFHKVERLPGNIGCLDLREFSDPRDGGDTAVSAMNFLAYCDALIIDLRKNRGGSGRMVQLIASYFFDRATHLTSYYHRGDDSTRQFWTHAQVQGPRMAQTPLYLVTGPDTASSSEELAYALKHLGRATLVGETTSGGAHATQLRVFPEMNFTLHLPIGYAVNPITGTNWEGRGVAPHVEASAREALNVAYREALRVQMEKEPDMEKKKKLEWVLDGIVAESQATGFNGAALTAYTGTYANSVKVWIENETLFIQRPGHEPYHAIPLGEDRFMLKDEEQRVKFIRDESGRVKELRVFFPDGRKISMARDGS